MKHQLLKKYWQSAKQAVSDYFEHSSIHGVNHIAEKDRSWFERIWWILVFCVSVFCCGKLIHDAWNINPIIISFTEKQTPLWQIPFPTVTICPNIYAKAKHIDLANLLRRLEAGYLAPEELTDEEKERMTALSTYCSPKILVPELLTKTDCNNCLKTLREIRIPPEELIHECKFQNQDFNCTAAFKELVNEYALCYTFNGYDVYRNQDPVSDEWSIDDGYKETADLNAYPRRALGAGTKFSLSIVLKIERRDINFECSASPGFWLLFRMPYDMPMITTNFYQTHLGESATLVVKPKKINTADALRDYSVASRKCYFSNERRLKYFQQYTQSNCEAECEVDLVLANCGCLEIFVGERGNVDTCGPHQFQCAMYVRIELSLDDFSKCHCLPACSMISFEAELYSNPLNMSEILGGHRKYQDQYQYSQVKIYFKEAQLMTSQRSELYGETDFLANCGGLMGLCLGISVISLFEIAYFCTLRLWFNLRNNKTDNHCQRAVLEENITRSTGLLEVAKDVLADYSKKTTIQGINYIANEKLSLFERLWWIVIVVISTICCGTLITDIFRRFDESPIIISFENNETTVSQIPFPAVTVCPQVVSHVVSEMYEWLNVYNQSLYELDEYSLNAAIAMAQLCDPELFSNVDPLKRTNCDKCIETLDILLGDSVMMICRYNIFDYQEPCSDMFRKEITEDGVCFTFNSLDVYRNDDDADDGKFEQWTLEDGFRNGTIGQDVYPRPGSRFPLIVAIAVNKAMNSALCKGPIEGYKVYLHLPNEVPQMSKHFYMVPYKQTMKFSITPKMITTAPELRGLSAVKRQCFFSDERILRFFRYYTQNNCELECVANLTLNECGCLRFNMPETPGVKFCGISDIICCHKVVEQGVERSINLTSDCNCLPACTEITFDTEITQSQRTDGIIERPEYAIFNIVEFSVVFRDSQFVAFKRSQLFGKTELLANCGSLLGLFLGFSMLSILELVYFCTIRLFCSFSKHFQKKK